MVLDYKANIMGERTSEANNKYMHGYGESNFIQYLVLTINTDFLFHNYISVLTHDSIINYDKFIDR